MAPAPQNERLIRALQARVALESANNNIHKRAAFSKAVEKVTAHRRGITSAVDIGTIKGIGVRIQKLLEKVLNGEEPEVPPGAQEALARGHAIPNDFNYVPKPGTGARAILIAMFRESKKPGYPGFLQKDQVQAAATATGISNTSLYAQPNIRQYYSAWSGMDTLCENGLAIRTKNGIGNHQHFSLTDKGWRLAFFLEEQMGPHGSGQAGHEAAGQAQSVSPANRRFSSHSIPAHRGQAGMWGFPEVMLERGADIERGNDLSQVMEVESASVGNNRLFSATCKSSTSVRKKYSVKVHARVEGAVSRKAPAFDGRIPEMVARLEEMGFSKERALAALESTDYNEELAVQQLLEGGSVPSGSAETGASSCDVIRSECNCPEGKSSNGRCKHAAALFLRVKSHISNGAELDRVEPGKKKATGKRQAVGDNGLPAKATPRKRKKAADAVLMSAEERNLAAIAAQLAKSGSPLPASPNSCFREEPRRALGLSPREMAAQAALERAAVQESLNRSRRDLHEGGVGKQAQGVARKVLSMEGLLGGSEKAGVGGGVAASLRNTAATNKKGKSVAFINLDSDEDDAPVVRHPESERRRATKDHDPESEEDAELLSFDWRSPGGGTKGGTGRESRRSSDWSMDDAVTDSAELDRLIRNVSNSHEPARGLQSSRPDARTAVSQVTVVVDETERQTNSNPNSVYLELHRQHAALNPISGGQLAAEKHKLEIGDYLWLAETPEGSCVLDTVIERKTMSDLVTRSAANAHLRQLQQMRASGLSNVCLLLEGDFRNARNFVANAGQACRGDVDSAEAVWQLMAELLVGAAEGVNVPDGVALGRRKSSPAPIRVLQSRDVKGTCKLLTHISSAIAGRLGEGFERLEEKCSLEDFNKEAKQRRNKIKKLVKEQDQKDADSEGRDAGTVPDGGSVAQEDWQDGTAEMRPLCEECDERPAAVQCRECEQALCAKCSERIHTRGARRSHSLTAVAAVPRCEECEAIDAKVKCRECEQALCQSCSDRIHSKGARARHTVEPLFSSPLEPPFRFPGESSGASQRLEQSSSRSEARGKQRSSVQIRASKRVYSVLRNTDLGLETKLEETGFPCPELDSGSLMCVQWGMRLEQAAQGRGSSTLDARQGCWAVMVKGDDFLHGMIKAQVEVSGSSRSSSCSEADLLAATALFLSSLPEVPATCTVKILVLENVYNHCRSVAAKAERERMSGHASGSKEADPDVNAFLACHDLWEEMLRWIVRIMFSHQWNVQMTANEVETGVLFKHLAKAFVRR